jgi:hypothetical protein
MEDPYRVSNTPTVGEALFVVPGAAALATEEAKPVKHRGLIDDEWPYPNTLDSRPCLSKSKSDHQY